MTSLMCISASATAFVPDFENIKSSIIKGRKSGALYTIKREIYYTNSGKDKKITEKISFTLNGKFKVSRTSSSGVHILIWNGSKGVDLLKGVGYCPKQDMSLDPIEKLPVVPNIKELSAILTTLGIDTALKSIAMAEDEFAYDYGAVREDEKRTQILIDPYTFKLVGIIINKEDKNFKPYKYIFKKYKRFDGGKYPSVINIFHGTELFRKVKTLNFHISDSIPPDLFNINRIISITPLRSACKIIPVKNQNTFDPDALIKDLDSMFGKQQK